MDFEEEEILFVLDPNQLLPLLETPNTLNQLYLDDEEELPHGIRNQGYFEEVVPRYSLDDYYMHFRMSRVVMELLVTNIAHRLDTGHISVDKQVAFTVWMLGKPEAFRACCDRFGIALTTGHNIFMKVCIALAEINKIVTWPTPQEAAAIENYFIEKNRFPGVIGAIDGCHIPIKAPVNNSIDYYNRKQFHSIILQATCNHQMLFTDIYIGMPGRCHDSRVFHTSPLFHKIVHQELIPQRQHILADSAYPLTQNVMVPFRDNGHLTPMQRYYNILLSSYRSKIEQAFGRLKGKWRRLKYLDMEPENAINAIAAACVLHNFTLLNDANEEQFQDVYEVAVEEPHDKIFNPNIEAQQKRLQIMQQLL